MLRGCIIKFQASNRVYKWHPMKPCMDGSDEQDSVGLNWDRQNSYADLNIKDIEYSFRDQVFLKVSPWLKVLRFRRKTNLSPRFIGPYRILKRVSLMIEVRSDLYFEEESVKILDHDVKVLSRKSIPLIKLLWQKHGTKEATWELEDTFRQQYPHLFELAN
ncbi:hypothetical protein EPI10_001082 [Gossypium australe]|uniref:Tf2-1-like SH3-like domain-containing protein n=1 Tax=Gossypium australe TaxID=47621 RepID=A0A5B6VAD4_9ROSI|nr:hypothetical protein EPI10_001082 [Gossypium australe]